MWKCVLSPLCVIDCLQVNTSYYFDTWMFERMTLDTFAVVSVTCLSYIPHRRYTMFTCLPGTSYSSWNPLSILFFLWLTPFACLLITTQRSFAQTQLGVILWKRDISTKYMGIICFETIYKIHKIKFQVDIFWKPFSSFIIIMTQLQMAVCQWVGLFCLRAFDAIRFAEKLGLASWSNVLPSERVI